MATLVIAEHDNRRLGDATARAVTAAQQIGGEMHLLVAGQDARAVAAAAGALNGVSKVIYVEGAVYAHHLAEPLADLVVSLATNYETLVFTSTSTGKSVAPRAAALLDVMVVSDVTRIISSDTFERPIYAGNAIQTVQSSDNKKVLTIRSSAFEPAGPQDPCNLEEGQVTPDPGISAWLEDKTSVSERPELNSAKIVVSGGRGVGSLANFRMIESLADKLGAAVGASRAAVDAGYAPNDLQVGQTGKIVAPDLYIAVGISGAIQHLAGMKDAKIIVAINKDGDAPIFEFADYGLVGDLFEILPELERSI